ncbi:putative membrane protein [Corynebacterium provencense]|uniref:Putative membrane protein n=1 Tax=Corynebacterium provencense TaxID=1737425 RepID=A0A2Z3YNK9_9CORY|nr:lipopolysaccharide assembly protein LapA domain-containing protein [Corynebacterium provencense]AWT25958.1 putative membrane protein [Corynebacterium provencense]
MTNRERDFADDTTPTAAGTPDAPQSHRPTRESTAGPERTGKAAVTRGTSGHGQVEDAADSGEPGDSAGTGTTVSTGSAGSEVGPSVAGSTWVGLIIGAVILVLLLVFILQNGDSVQLHMFVWQWNFPIGVGMLIAAVAGALIAACVGTVRILQLRHQVRKGH